MPYKIITIDGNIGSGKSTLLSKLKEYYKNSADQYNIRFLDEPIDKFYTDQEIFVFVHQIMAFISRLSTKTENPEKISISEMYEKLFLDVLNNERDTIFITERRWISERFDGVSTATKTIDKPTIRISGTIPTLSRMFFSTQESYNDYLASIPPPIDVIVPANKELFDPDDEDEELFVPANKNPFDPDVIDKDNYEVYLKWFDDFALKFSENNIIYVKTLPNICYSRIHNRSIPGEELINLQYLEECEKYNEIMINNNTDAYQYKKLYKVTENDDANNAQDVELLHNIHNFINS